MCDEGLNFGDSHFGGVALVLMDAERVAFAPVEVDLFGAIRVVLGTDGVAELIEKFFSLRGRRWFVGWRRQF